MRQAVVWVAALVWCVAARAEIRRDLRLAWSELDPVVTGRDASVTLTNGQLIKGKVRAVESEGLRMRILFATDEKRFPSKVLLVPADEVVTIRLEKRTKRWRAILTPGIPLLLITAMAKVVDGIHPKPQGAQMVGIGAAVAGGGAIGGYILGWKLDSRETVTITIVR